MATLHIGLSIATDQGRHRFCRSRKCETHAADSRLADKRIGHVRAGGMDGPRPETQRPEKCQHQRDHKGRVVSGQDSRGSSSEVIAQPAGNPSLGGPGNRKHENKTGKHDERDDSIVSVFTGSHQQPPGGGKHRHPGNHQHTAVVVHHEERCQPADAVQRFEAQSSGGKFRGSRRFRCGSTIEFSAKTEHDSLVATHATFL